MISFLRRGRVCAAACVAFVVAPFIAASGGARGCGNTIFVAVRGSGGVALVAPGDEGYDELLEGVDAGTGPGLRVDVPLSDVYGPLWSRRIRWIQFTQAGVFSPAEESQLRALIARELVSERRLTSSEARTLAATGRVNAVVPNPGGLAAGAAWGLACFAIGVNLVGLTGRQRARRSLERLQAGVCPACAYPIAGVKARTCPECGTDIGAELASATACLAAHRPPAG
jgi:hypothetical protein